LVIGVKLRMTEEQRFSRGQKWSFGMGTFSQWFINSAFNTWVFAFYFTAVGLDIIYIMTAFIIWTIWNAINDPLLGYLSDRTHTRWGRRKPYIMLGTIPMLIIEIIVWIPPLGNELLTFLYLLILLFCYDTFYTMVTFFDSLFPELYTSVKERAEVNTIKQILATVGLILAFLIPGMFIIDTHEMMGYFTNGIVTSIIVGISLFIAIKWGAVEKPEFKLDYKHDFSFLKGLKYTLKNRGFVLYTIMFFLFEYTLMLYGYVVPLWSRHILMHESGMSIAILLGSLFIVGIISVLLWKYLDVKLGSKNSYAIALILFVVSIIPVLFITDYLIAVLVLALAGIGFGGMIYFIYLLIADVIDEDELKTGVRREGTFFGVTNFFMRLSAVLSIISVSSIFLSTGWEEWTQNPAISTLLGIQLLMFLFPAIAIVCSLLCLYFYPFTKAKVNEIKVKLEVLHNEKKEKIERI
jgi:GPH family glycoside/pentoside/hexuronide:cation symporter